MKKNRLDILKRVYKEAVGFGTLESGLTIGFNEFLIDAFDYEYLEQKGYIKLGKSPAHSRDSAVIYITTDGVDIVESLQCDKKVEEDETNDELMNEMEDLLKFSLSYIIEKDLQDDFIKHTVKQTSSNKITTDNLWYFGDLIEIMKP